MLIGGFIALGVFGSRLDDSSFHKSGVRYTDFLQMSKEIGYGLKRQLSLFEHPYQVKVTISQALVSYAIFRAILHFRELFNFL